ncbi:MAG: hypothetical protein DLM63_00065 [Solirubrobacterales bacterium]|nr:MAG: hypothetical protein DLM63_00065 [Solirubrobacterales bacterium]
MTDQAASPVLWPQFAPPRIALRKLEAAKALGVSDETFDKYVKPHVRCVRWGSLRLYPVSELVRFAEQQAAAPLDGRP